MYGTPVEMVSQPTDTYGFVNEHVMRMATAIALVLGIYSFVSIVFLGQFALPMICIGLIWVDFLLKVFFGPEYSLFGKIAEFFVQDTYWVGAMQKRFAWSIGLFLSTFAFGCILIVSGFLANTFGITTEIYTMVQTIPVFSPMKVPFTPPLLACLLCIVFMTLEAVFGYCVGCAIYAKLVKWGIMKKIPNQTCANGVCER